MIYFTFLPNNHKADSNKQKKPTDDLNSDLESRSNRKLNERTPPLLQNFKT